MRVFQSISGHNSELNIANHSSRPTVSQLKLPPTLYQTDLRITNHSRQISTVTNAPFIQNSNQMASRLSATTSFQRIFSQLLQYLTQRLSFSAYRATLMTKTDLTFPTFSLKSVDLQLSSAFAVSFYSRRRDSFRHYIKQIDSMLACVCSVIDHRRRQNVVRTSVTHSAIASCATFLFLPNFGVFCDLFNN